MSLRERAVVFAAIAGVLIFAAFSVFLNPLYARQKMLLGAINGQQNQIAGVDADIAQKLQASALDPDAANRARLQQARKESAALGAELRAIQKGLVPPDRMAALLEHILRANGKLQLLSLKTLATAPAAPGADASAAPAAAASFLLHRHGVEIVVQGGYLEMVAYMAALEAMPGQLFWGDARFNVEQFPTARLSLTLYTLSLDKKWIKL